jgi:hypothetical protein
MSSLGTPTTEDFGFLQGGTGGQLRADWLSPSRADLRLVLKAIKENWPVPPERGRPLMANVFSLLTRRNAPARLGLAVCWLGIAAEAHNLGLDRAEGQRRAKRKLTIQECLALPANRWTTMPRSGVWHWENPRASIGYSLDPTLSHLDLVYSLSDSARQHWESVAYSVQLLAEQTRFGGRRWFFMCPLAIKGNPCRRRVRTLYLPPGQARLFGCRFCHRLTYSSQQASRRSPRVDQDHD